MSVISIFRIKKNGKPDYRMLTTVFARVYDTWTYPSVGYMSHSEKSPLFDHDFPRKSQENDRDFDGQKGCVGDREK